MSSCENTTSGLLALWSVCYHLLGGSRLMGMWDDRQAPRPAGTSVGPFHWTRHRTRQRTYYRAFPGHSPKFSYRTWALALVGAAGSQHPSSTLLMLRFTGIKPTCTPTSLLSPSFRCSGAFKLEARQLLLP